MSDTKQEPQKGKTQILESKQKMESLQRLTYEDIKHIQLKNEHFEKNRRIQDEEQRNKRA